MGKTVIQNPLIPKELTVNLNSGSLESNSHLRAFQIGKLVLVSGAMQPRATGTGLRLATIMGLHPKNEFTAPIGAYNNQAQEVYIKDATEGTAIEFNLTAITHLKLNFCFIAQ